MAKKQLGLIDEGLIQRIDGVRGDVPRIRWVVRALEAALGGRAEVRGNVGPTTTTARPASPQAFEPEPSYLDDPHTRAEKARYLAASEGGKKPVEVRVVPGSIVPQRFMCPRDCRGEQFRPTSEKARCPVCTSRVVPEP